MISSSSLANEATFDSKQIQLKSSLATPVLEAGKPQNAFIRISLTGYEFDEQIERTPLNVAIVLDQSSSMSGHKIRQAKQAAKMAVEQLDANDIVSIITYDNRVKILVPATKARDKHRIYQRIDHIFANGNTALYAGTRAGGNEVRKFLSHQRVNRVVLLSDGKANVGPSTASEVGLLGYQLAQEGISVSTIGLGLSYNEDLMTQLADYSDGNHHFVENAADLAYVFEQEFGSAHTIVAQNINIKIIMRDGIEPIRIIGRHGEINENIITTKINQIYSEQENYVIFEVKIPENEEGSSQIIANVEVSYDHMGANKRFEIHDSISAKFSESKKEIRESVDKDAYESVVSQVANEQRKQAIEFRDQGKTEEASQALKTGSNLLEQAANYISSKALRQESEDIESEASSITSGTPSDWQRTRKELKAKSYSIDKQQR